MKKLQEEILMTMPEGAEQLLNTGNVFCLSQNESLYFLPFVYKRIGNVWAIAADIKFPSDWTNEQVGEAYDKIFKEPASLKYTVE